jgi:hypothetical protein
MSARATGQRGFLYFHEFARMDVVNVPVNWNIARNENMLTNALYVVDDTFIVSHLMN